MDPRQRIQQTLQNELARRGMRGQQQGVPTQKVGMNGMNPAVARLADGAIRSGLQQKSEQRETVVQARQLYEKTKPWGDATPQREKTWKQHGRAFMQMLDENPGLERKFVISPEFAAFVTRNLGFVSKRQLPQQNYQPAAPTPGIGLLSDRAPRARAELTRPKAMPKGSRRR